jgi:hypothetical protein
MGPGEFLKQQDAQTSDVPTSLHRTAGRSFRRVHERLLSDDGAPPAGPPDSLERGPTENPFNRSSNFKSPKRRTRHNSSKSTTPLTHQSLSGLLYKIILRLTSTVKASNS